MNKPLITLISSLIASAAFADAPAVDDMYLDESTPDAAEVLDWDAPDLLQGASCVPTPFLDFPEFDRSWNFGRLNNTFSPTPSPLAAPTIGGYNGSAPNGTEALAITASGASATPSFATWRRDLGVPLEGETLYRVRSVVSSDALPNAGPWTRIRFGGDFHVDNGQGELGYTSRASSMPHEPRTHTILHWVKRSSSGESLPTGWDRPAYNFDVIDEALGLPSSTFTVSSVTIDSITRDCLGAGTVIRNKGIEFVSNEDGYTPSDDGRTPFTGADGYEVLFLNDEGSSVNVTTSVTTPLAGAMNINFATTEPGDQNGFAALLVTDNPGEAVVTIDNSKVYAIDTWFSAPIAPNSTTSRLPVLRPRWIADQTVPYNHGQNQATYYSLNPDFDFDGEVDNFNGVLEADSARHHASFWWPDLDTIAQPITDSTFFIDFLYVFQGSAAIRPNGTLSLERMTITEYDQPTF